MRKYTAEELLEAREERADLLSRLLTEHNLPLLVMRVNFPGLQKTNPVTWSIIQDLSALICTLWGDRISYKALQAGAEGPIFLAAVKEEVFALKKAAIDLEEKHVLGRCLDLDVYDFSGRSVSRQELGYSRRTCYLCEDYAQNCVRARRHSEREVIDYIEARFREYKRFSGGNGEFRWLGEAGTAL